MVSAASHTLLTYTAAPLPEDEVLRHLTPTTPAPTPKCRREGGELQTPKKINFPAVNYSLPKVLGECVSKDIELSRQVSWEDFVETRQKGGNLELEDLNNIEDHPARRLLRHYKNRGVPVKLATPKWDTQRLRDALSRGAHKSCNNHLNFLSKKFEQMIQKGQWVVLPISMSLELKGLCLSPPGVVPQRDQRPW